jgi:single-stranded-DNA-specific exonuclease
MKEKYHTPAFVMAEAANGTYKGSARSVDEFNVKDALDKINQTHPDILAGYGGHAKAAGFTIQKGKVEDFVKVITAMTLDALKGIDLFKKKDPELIVAPYEFNPTLYNEIQSMQPFGEGFPIPLIQLNDLFGSCMNMSGGKHAKIMTKGNNEVIYWNCPKNLAFTMMSAKSFTGRMDINTWNGRTKVQLIGEL